jgi:hypothetical protein
LLAERVGAVQVARMYARARAIALQADRAPASRPDVLFSREREGTSSRSPSCRARVRCDAALLGQHSGSSRRLHPLRAHEAVACEAHASDARRDERGDKKRRPRVPWSRDKPADKRQRRKRHGRGSPPRSRCGDEKPSRPEQHERSLAHRHSPFIAMLHGESEASRRKERVDDPSHSKWYARLPLHPSSL